MKKKMISLAAILMMTGLASGLVACGENPSASTEPAATDKVTDTAKPTDNVTEKQTIHVDSITVTAEKQTLFVGEETRVSVSVLPDNADDKTYTIASSAMDVLSVDQDGKVTALKAGSSDIIATSTDGAKTGKVTVTVVGASAPTIVLPEVVEYTVKAGESLTLPSVTAKDYKGNDITDQMEIEDGFESGTIKNGVFLAQVAGDHEISYYVADPNDEELYDEQIITVHVTATHEENFDTNGFEDPSALKEYGTFKENFAKGAKSVTSRAMADAHNATYLTAGDEAIAGNSLVIDANRTAGSAAYCIYFNQFNDYFQRGISATYTLSFSYKILSDDIGNFSDFYAQLNWDGSNGMNQTFIPSSAKKGEVYEATISFPGTKIPTTGNAWFGFFKLGGSNTETRIAIDSLTFSAQEIAQVDAVVPTSEELTAGFSFDMETKGAECSNGETVIIDNLSNETAKAAMKGSEYFSKNALKLTNADDHFFSGLTKNNLVTGKKLTLTMYYYSVNNKGLHLLMMGDNGNPSLDITDTDLGNGIHSVTYIGVLQSGWRQLNIYGQGNSAFEIYVGRMDLKLSEPDPVAEDETENGYKVGFNFSQQTRSFGTCNDTNRAVEAFDNKAEVIANETMGTAPQKVTFKKSDTTVEWLRGDGRIENAHTYKITFDYYVDNWNGQLMFNFDNNVFLPIDSDMASGYHHKEIEWVSNRKVDFFSFYTPGSGGTGVFYVGNLNVELIKISK